MVALVTMSCWQHCINVHLNCVTSFFLIVIHIAAKSLINSLLCCAEYIVYSLVSSVHIENLKQFASYFSLYLNSVLCCLYNNVTSVVSSVVNHVYGISSLPFQNDIAVFVICSLIGSCSIVLINFDTISTTLVPSNGCLECHRHKICCLRSRLPNKINIK